MITQGTRKLFRENLCASKTNQRIVDNSIQMQSDDSDEERELTNLNWLLRNQNLTWPKTIDTNIDDDVATNIDLDSISTKFHKPNENDSLSPHGCHSPQSKPNLIQLMCTTRQNLSKKHSVQSLAAASICEPKKPGIRGEPVTPPTKRPSPAERYDIFIGKIKRDLAEYEKSANKYETDVTEKPPFNYSHIIGMAMLENGRVTLQQICSWIESKFAFFRVRKKWNNSIRHNLSLHHCFRNRKREEKGKGGYWELGVDPKKCDRKRIRNRKSAHSKQNQKPTVKKGFAIAHHLHIPSQAQHQVKSDLSDKGNGEIFVDECNQVLSRTYLHAQDPIQDDEAIQVRYRRCSQLVECNKINDAQEAVQLEPSSQSFTLTEVGLDLGLSLSSMPSPQMSEDVSNALSSAVMQMTTITNEGICLQQQYGLGTIIISTTGIIDESSGLNCLITDKYGCASMICKEDELPPPPPNESSLSTVLTSTLDSVTSDSHRTPDATMTNCDYTNFRPFMESMDEPFHCLHSGAEINRVDEILDKNWESLLNFNIST